MIMQDNEKKPALRFKGFTDPWEQRKLGEICDFITKGATPTTYGFSWQPDGVPFFRNDSIKDNVFVFGEFSYISEAANEVLKRSEVHGNDILIAITGDIGKVGIIPDTVEKANINQHIARVRIRKEALPYFVYQYLASDDTQKEYQKIKTGLSMPQLSLEQVRDIVVKIPEFNEQGKIADCLRRIDTLITLHQRKYEKLVNIKKSMLDKMFPKNGASVPEIRFKGFTDPWEQRKLTNLCEKFTDGDWIEAKDQSDSGVRLVQTGNVGVTEYLDKPNNKKWISFETFEQLHCEEVYPGDILISRLPEPAGRACIMPNLGTKMITAVDCTIVRPNAVTSTRFLLQYLSSQAYFDAVNTCLAGGTRQRISRGNLAQFNVPIPSSKIEQEKIGEVLEKLDTLITLHQRKLEKLQNIKKSCLEKMFV